MRQVESSPLVSIGMPVYNGEEYISQALDSLLAQTHTNFELIISDNVSTDGTWGLCQRYAVKDTRIQLYQNDENLGVYNNINRVLELSSGKYFMWAAHDDIWHKDFISELVNLLEDTSSAVLAACRSEKITYAGNAIKSGPVYLTTINMTRAERLRYFAQYANGWLFYGLYRSDIARDKMAVFLNKQLSSAHPEVLFMHKCIDSGDLTFTEKVLTFKRQSKEDHQTVTNFEVWKSFYLHCYGSLFKCYHFNDLSFREIVLVYLGIVKGFSQRSSYIILHHKVYNNRLVSILRGIKSLILSLITFKRR